MRIGIDASRAFVPEPTGTERYSYEVITRMLKLPEAGKHDWVLYVRKGQKARVESQRYGTEVKIVEIGLPYLWTQAGLAWRTWADGLDVLWVPAHTLPVARRPGVKTVVTIHGIEYEWLPAYENALQRWYLPLSTKYAVGAADRVIAVSEFTKSQLVEKLGSRDDKIDVVYEGGNESGQELGNKSVLREYGLERGKYLLFVGTVQPRKNLVRLIEAFSRLGGGLKLVIAGKLGWSFEDVLEAPKKSGVEDKVVITGYIDEAKRYSLLHNALLYVQPSITEGFGLPVLEAWGAGVPVVSSGGGALGELVEFAIPGKRGKAMKTGRAGLVFDPYNTEDMAEKMTTAVKDGNLRKELIEKGEERLKDFSWDKAARETYNILCSFE